MQKKHHFNIIVVAAVAICVGLSIWACTSIVHAMAPLVVQYPKDGSILLDQPLFVRGTAPVNTKVYVTIDGKYVGNIAVDKTKNKKATTTTYQYTYTGKRLATGMHTVDAVAQTLDKKTSSNVEHHTFTVPATTYRKIDGKLVSNAQWNLLPFAIMIENTLAARPQAGLSQASVVYETLAEGGVTRFEAIFPQTNLPKFIGPVRSARPYYVDWASEYQAIYLHAGGSRDAFNEVGKLKLRSYDALTKLAAKYTVRKCYGVHCLFTTNVFLGKLLSDHKLTNLYATSVGWQFQDPSVLASRPTKTKTLTINFNSKTYLVQWKYDRKSNAYLRWNGGVVAKDKNTGKQLAFTNVVVQRVPKEKVLDRAGHLAINLVGKGDATLYRDGQSIALRWEKKSAGARTLYFLKGKNTQVSFDRGNTWVEVVPGTRSVTYK